MSLGKKEKCHNVRNKFMIPMKEKYINDCFLYQVSQLAVVRSSASGASSAL